MQEARKQESKDRMMHRIIGIKQSGVVTLTFRGYVFACVRCSFIVTSFQGSGYERGAI